MYTNEDEEEDNIPEEEEEEEDLVPKLKFINTELLPNTEQAMLKKQKILEEQKK